MYNCPNDMHIIVTIIEYYCPKDIISWYNIIRITQKKAGEFQTLAGTPTELNASNPQSNSFRLYASLFHEQNAQFPCFRNPVNKIHKFNKQNGCARTFMPALLISYSNQSELISFNYFREILIKIYAY